MYTTEIARVIPFFDTDLHTGRLANAGTRAELRPYSWLGIYGDAAMDAETRHVDAANVDFYVSKGHARFALGQRYLRDESSQMTTELRWKLSQDMDLKVYERFEFQTNNSKEFEVTLSKAFDCLIVDFTYNHRQNQGDTFFFAFSFKSYPKTSFGLNQSYDRPKASSEPL